MKENSRKILLVFATVCFAVTATGAMLALHLAAHDKDEHHSHKTCPVCQQGMLNKKPAVLLAAAKTCEPAVVGFKAIYEISEKLLIRYFELPRLRGPPFAR